MKHIPIIALTGGPCAGKSTLLTAIEQKLSDLGFVVVTISEVATELMLAGLKPHTLGVDVFQRAILEHSLQKESLWIKFAKRIHGKVVILCDRGVPDIAAYTSPALFERMLAERKLTLGEVRDQRYDAAVFLVSVAVDAPHLYTCENNAARRETVEQAVEANARTLEAWTGHSHLRVIDNSTDLVGKRTRVMEVVCRVLGIPAPLEIERKYLVSDFDVSRIPAPVQPVEITQYYLKAADPLLTERIRARSQGGGRTFYHTTKRVLADGVREELEHKIFYKEYLELLERVDPDFNRIDKTRYCFVWRNQYFELDVFHRPQRLLMLEHELTKEDEVTIIPDFLEGRVTDVMNDPAYTNVEIARRQ